MVSLTFHWPPNPVQCPVSTRFEGGKTMISHLFYYQLALLALVWLFVMLHVAWPKRGVTTPPMPVTPIIKPRRKGVNEPLAFDGLTTKPHCALCE